MGGERVDVTVLDGMLDARAAGALVAHRPFASVTAMGPLPYIGGAALGRLRAEAGAWWFALRAGVAPPLAGVFDGVTFDDATAAVALDIANLASAPQLQQHGMTATTAGLIVAHRPYVTLAAVAAVDGVGSATMLALRGYAQGGTWVPPGQ